ncbi:PEP-CTERM sorting domain-containing protein [Planctomycetota bacterium]
MKSQLLALMLVLLLACAADAALSFVVGDGTTFTDPGDEFTIDIGETIWIGVHDDVGEMYFAEITNSLTTIGEWTGDSIAYSPPTVSTAKGWSYYYRETNEIWSGYFIDEDSVETPLPGIGGAVEFRGLTEGEVLFCLNLTPGTIDDVFTLNVVPEPATVLLLSLGSLALLKYRNKKGGSKKY